MTEATPPRWEWDPNKNEANQRKHGLSFQTAVLAFDDPLAVTDDDPYPHEQRWRTTGMVNDLLVVVVHTLPKADARTGHEIGRIISARKATKRERDDHEQGDY